MCAKKMTRLLALFLALLMLSACGSKEPEQTPTAETVDTAAETAAETEPAEYVVPGVDYDGADFTVAAIDYTISGGGTWEAQNYCDAYSESTGEVLHDALFERNSSVMEDLNVNLKVYSLSGFEKAASEFKTPVMAGEAAFDYCLMNGSGLTSILSSGVLMDLNDITTLDTNHSWWDRKSVEEFTLGGTIFTMTGDISLMTGISPIVYYFNKQLIEQNALEDPYTLVNEGKWTLDKTIEMATAVANDLNGNGKVDTEEDIFGLCCEGLSMVYAAQSADVSFTGKDEAGMPCVDMPQERAATVVEKLQPFYNAGNIVLMSEKITGYTSTFFELFVPALQEGRTLFFNNQLLIALNLREMDTDFGILPSPKYDEAQENYCCPISYWWATFVTVPVTNNRLDMTGHVLESVGYYSQKLVTPALIEKSIQGKTFRDEESSAMLELILDNRVYELASIYDWGGINSMFAQLALTPSGFASTYASKEKAAISAIEKTIQEIEALG